MTYDLVKEIKENKQKRLSGEITCLPFKLPRLDKVHPGLIRSHFYCFAAASSVGKTTVVKKLCVWDAVDTFIKQGIKGKVLYFALEETKSDFVGTLASYLLERQTSIRSNKIEFNSFIEPLSDATESALERLEPLINQYLEYIEVFDDITNTFGIHKEVRDFAATRGKFFKKGVRVEPDAGYDLYVPDDKDEFIIVIVDHISELDPQKDEKDLSEAMTSMSKYARMQWAKKYNYVPVFVQQFAQESENLEHKKMNSLFPTMNSLGDNKRVARAYTDLFALFDPSRSDLKTWDNYNVENLGGYYRSLGVLKSRYSKRGIRVSLFMDGKTGRTETLPYSGEVEKLENYYRLAQEYG